MPASPDRSFPAQLRISRGWLFRAGGSAALLALVLWFLPTDQVSASLSNLSGGLFVSILLLFMASHVAAAAKWWFLLSRGVAFRSAVRAHFVGLAANLCLPGVAGGDVVRAGLVMRELGDTARLVTVSLADRLVDTLALGLLTLFGLLLLGPDLAAALALGDISAGWLIALIGGPCLLALVAGFGLLPWFSRRLSQWTRRGRRSAVLEKAAAALENLAQARRDLVIALVASLIIQAGILALAIALAEGVGVNAPAAVWIFAWPLAKILAVAPISLGGIGVREASLASLMAPFGADPAGVVAASLIWQGVLFATGGIGAVAWILTFRYGARQVGEPTPP